MTVYLVGGAVRDELLKLPITEKDWVVVGRTPEAMLQNGFRAVGKDFPVFLHPNTQEEYALARTERKVSKGYTGFEFYTACDVTLEQDLLRRDLTINAIAKDAKGNLIDPYNGMKDIEDKVLRHVSPAFAEDPVRILRVARFYARFAHMDFSIAPETAKLMRVMVKNGEVNALVRERVWQELHKALQTQSPDKFIDALRLCDALKILMPELNVLYGVPNKAAYHPEIDSGVHTMMVLQQACLLSKEPQVRFAALLHDLGKALTPMHEWPSHKGHENRGLEPIKILCSRLNAPKQFRALALAVGELHDLVYSAFELRSNTILKLFEKVDAFRRPERFKLFLLACEADSRGRPGYENMEYPYTDYLLKNLEAAASVDIRSLVEAGLTGDALVNKIRQKRISAIKENNNSCR
jgi:tRNA nucleotidyltransferase (CCA-adding enzyme)